MKKLFFFALATVFFASCSTLINTASYTELGTIQPATGVIADLAVSPTKISYVMIPSKAVIRAGRKNMINSAVREALLANGNADVLVALNTQIKYKGLGLGRVESIIVTGYPAKYVNFRSPGDEYLLRQPAGATDFVDMATTSPSRQYYHKEEIIVK